MSFDLWPAIDLKSGECVRLLRGDMKTAQTYASDPARQAFFFRDVGFSKLHVVDLDGATSGEPVNADAVKAILYETDAEVQLGGGIRDMAAIERWLELGVTRVVLGTAAVRDPKLVRAAARAFPQRVVLGLDTKNGHVATDGWVSSSDLTADDLIARYAELPLAAIVATDIERDGAMDGPNTEGLAALARTAPFPVIASGGVTSLADIEALVSHARANLHGAIIGRALYEGMIDPAAALALAAQAL